MAVLLLGWLGNGYIKEDLALKTLFHVLETK